MILVCCKSLLFMKKSPIFLKKVCQSILYNSDVHNTFSMKYNVYMSFWANKYYVSQSTYITFNAHKMHCKVNLLFLYNNGPKKHSRIPFFLVNFQQENFSHIICTLFSQLLWSHILRHSNYIPIM
jgi:hypothetical protein